MHIEISFEFPGTQTRQVSKPKPMSVREESRPMLNHRLFLVAFIAILAALLIVQVVAALTSADGAMGLSPAEELVEASAQVSTVQNLPITSPYQDNPISISGGGSMCLYR